MSMLSWNVQGLGNSRTFCDLKNLLQDKKPDIVGLQVVLLSSSSGHIDVSVTFPNSFVTWITGFYGHLNPSQRIHS
ncbi:unnamed protein product [Prunus armeniaca]|uniref:Endonuclease/exonuclease/phosphatase domain-containing protein n=1 Tax=Prunus armeniaca TaxID=36596 RepID=A0A6J5XTZ4_PRUAR|nr:unnamed protein product [Prunus armeniaca]CAB4317239.1 unnamed protein product [Prunus armeniaca]